MFRYIALTGALVATATFAQGKIEPEALMSMDKGSYPRAYKAWGATGFKKVNELLPQAAQLVVKSKDCASLSMIGLSDERSEPASKKVVFFADCQDRSKAYVRYYVTEQDIKANAAVISDKAAAAALSDSDMDRACYAAAKERMKFPSSFRPYFGGTDVSRSTAKPGNVEVVIAFEAKNSIGATLPHRAVCSFQGGKFVEIDIQPR
jgi:hypothetical protein